MLVAEELETGKICDILLVEDDEDDFYFFNTALLSLNRPFQLLRTTDGIMLCSLIQAGIKPSVVFLDINMPYRNGIACLKEIRSNDYFNSVRVIMYSTSASPKDIDICYKSGANFYLVKPTCYSIASQQLQDLFENFYFKNNTKPPREEFVLHVREESNR